MTTTAPQPPMDPLVHAQWRLEVLTPAQVAAEWGMSEDWLQRMRTSGDGPPFRKMGRTVKYVRGDMIDWLESQKFKSTAAYRGPDSSEGSEGDNS